MASPTVELCSSESSLSEDAALEMTTRGSAVRDRNASGKSDVSKSPTSDTKPKGSHSKKSVSAKASGATTAEDSSEQPSSGRKKRARATPADDMETNSRKSATDTSGRESSLWPGAEGEGPVQGSLLEEVLAEKRMALMRSPEVLQFLQQRQAVTQAVTQAAQQQALLEAQQQADFSVGEVEEDANS